MPNDGFGKIGGESKRAHRAGLIDPHPHTGLTMLLRFLIALTLFLVSSSVTAAYRNSVDLISLHYDHAPDRDDGHATVAAFMVVSKLGIQPHVVSGAYGQHNDHRYQPPAELVMQATWGNNWLNAHSNWNASVNQTATRWIQVINSGGHIYVAEGGQSDFTADVVRSIRNQTSINTKNRITVVQHSAWNERMASATDLSYVKAQTNYVKINDGNNDNATADLNKRSDSFVAKARSGQYSSQWTAAFNYLPPSSKLDFSDTVELLHILGVSKNKVATVDDFGDEYFSGTPTAVVPASGPQNWSDSYSVDGQCYCDTTFDHGLNSVTVTTLQGPKLVTQVCSDIKSTFGTGAVNNRVYYNTVQCGHDPRNTAADETACPGIPDSNNNYTGPNCKDTGATWNLDTLYPAPVVTEPVVTQPVVTQPVVTQPVVTQPVVAQPVTTPVNIIDFPLCSAFIADDNLDGYGWENNQTCMIDSQAQPVQGETPVSFPLCSISVTDHDGDGYAWENNQTCEVPATTSVPVVFPACSEQAQDTDGDGYAWENNQTCAVNAVVTATPALIVFPECSQSIIDSDGDGYGWENNQTCAVQSQTALSGTNSVIDFPDCSARVIDTDGDGYGWENNQTCSINSQAAVPVSLVAFPTCSAAIRDDDSDGYGWENNQTCAIDASASSPTQPPLAEITFPACSAAISDTDADGYGWENNQSCYFGSSTGSQSTNAFQGSTVTIISFPACSVAVLDDNYDGYGWENNQTCQITSNTGQTDPSPIAIVTFPACSSQLIDTDGDGYGWENNQSCTFVQPHTPASSETVTITGTIYPVCSPLAVDSNGDGFEWENNTTCVISASIPTLLELSNFPICSIAVVDENFDGYGWENNGSCRIVNY